MTNIRDREAKGVDRTGHNKKRYSSTDSARGHNYFRPSSGRKGVEYLDREVSTEPSVEHRCPTEKKDSGSNLN